MILTVMAFFIFGFFVGKHYFKIKNIVGLKNKAFVPKSFHKEEEYTTHHAWED